MGCNSSSPKVDATKQRDSNDFNHDSEFSGDEIDEQIFTNESSTNLREVDSFRTFFNQQETPQIFEYRFLRPVGRGAQAEVYLAVNVETNESLAAKVI